MVVHLDIHSPTVPTVLGILILGLTAIKKNVHLEPDGIKGS
jgi:hypothetical protein